MIYKYDYKEFCYIPIHLNSLFYTRSGFKESMSVNKELFNEIESNIKDENEKILIFDFSEILIIEQRGIGILTDIFSYKQCIITNSNKLINDRIGKECNIAELNYNNGIWYFKDFKFEDIGCLQESSEIISNILRQFYLNPANAPLEETFIDSSNVFANKYLDVKKLFYKPNLNNLAIYQISKSIYINHINSFDKILSVSMNGAALGAQVGQILGKDLLLIMNLGPHLSLRDKEILNKIKKGMRYLFIGDMICMGTEIKLAKTIINLKDAKWAGGVTIFKYLEPGNRKPITSIIQIYDNDDDDKNLGYSLYVKNLKQ